MHKIIVAGATGYLGKHIVAALQHREIGFKAIARNSEKLLNMGVAKEQIITVEVTKPESLKGCCKGANIMISTVGITRQKDNMTYMDVDYQANINLLKEAQKSGIKKFIYIAAINGNQMRHLKIMEAKECFVDALKLSGMDYTIIRPNGFFSDLKDFLIMAQQGKMFLFGDGEFKLNPIHGADLALVCLDAIDSNHHEMEVGGPDVFTQNEIADLALLSYGYPTKIAHIPDVFRRLTIKLLRIFTSSKTYGPFEFFLSMMGQDNIAPRYGMRRLEHFFKEEVDRIDGKH